MQIPSRPQRHLLPADFTVTDWAALEPYFQQLADRSIASVDDLKNWLSDRSELESLLEEEMGWRYIRMTCDTTNPDHTAAFHFFVEEIEPNIAPFANLLNEKLNESPFAGQLDSVAYQNFLRNVRKDIEIFREENIPLQTQIQTEQQRYGAISAAMTVTLDGHEFTLQQAAVRLQETDRDVRQSVYEAIQSRRLQESEQLNELYTQLLGLRHQVAQNAGFENFRDYMFKAMGRFDYTPADCFAFHEAVAEQVVPLLNGLAEHRRQALELTELRPWDLAVDEERRNPLKPFSSGEELLDKTIQAFYNIDKYLGDCLSVMKEMGHLDLVSRKGKAPGGYNYPLDEIGVPFIFMNATSTLRDLVTLLHEGGHAVHSFLTREQPLQFFKHPPSEVAELASMSMELISMEQWHLFFENEDDLRRAKREHLAQILETLPWVATIDKFQHWVYENPTHTLEQRKAAWLSIYEQFSPSAVNWSGYEHFKANIWQKQLHLFEVPFYYIEYAIAQLGAVAVWKNYKENPQRGLEGYLNALRLGYAAPISQIYEAAYIRFDFSKEYIKELMDFVSAEMKAL
ncbi:oligoendopeptidase F [Flexibacter flexilis DSM 6793]|uniref:Oligoendopeptidase F n=1 Tax=Flexibacter flexilis DSM 6793 TaxID=927664 RepID=A0A1I1IU14_9BACT|nr:M3 family oligoendopeptidase [Flexibacter flexilis]SFC39675.1 oligoendopeptidase F [Flexibacter flexilis DSM 6793]